MLKRLLPVARRNLPAILKLSAFSLSYLFLKNHLPIMKPIQCFQFPTFTNNIIAQVLPNIIRIQHNGQIIGYAYCFSERYLVCVCHQLFDQKINVNQCDFYVGELKINAKFKVIGKFQHLTFLHSENNTLNVSPGKQPELYTQVQIVHNRSYLSINNGYYVANDSGFGIINGKGQVGSLVVNQDGIVGIVTQIGRDTDEGFLRVIFWKDMKNIANRFQNYKQSNFYLGMSVVSSEQRQGIAVVRVAPNSPLSSHVKMGDIVKKVNNSTINKPDDLIRVIMLSQKKVVFQIQDQEKNKKIITVDL